MRCIVIKIIILVSFCNGVNCIIGGRFAKPDEFPHQVQLFLEDQFFCGGVIISQYAIMTSSHCIVSQIKQFIRKDLDLDLVEYTRKLRVVAGTNELSTSKDFNSYRRTGGTVSLQIRNILEQIFSKGYVRDDLQNVSHDFMIFILKFPLEYNKHVKNIQLPGNSINISDLSETVTIAGWGATDLKSKLSPKLKVIQGKISNKCWKDLQDGSVINTLTDGLLNLGEKGKTLCVETKPGELIRHGDSGSPILCYKKDDTRHQFPFLCGLISTSAMPVHDSMKLESGSWSVHMILLEETLELFKLSMRSFNFRMKCTRERFYIKTLEATCYTKEFICRKNTPQFQEYYIPDEELPEDANVPSSSKCSNYAPCGKDQFRCFNGECVDKEKVCDGEGDCNDIPSFDSSDEDKCPSWEDAELCKGESLYYCGPKDRCIPAEWKCDGVADCLTNESDEDVNECFCFSDTYYFSVNTDVM